MFVDVPMVSNDCTGHVSVGGKYYSDPEYYGCNSGFEFVAGDKNAQADSCNGGSGRPVFIAAQGAHLPLGITSRGVTAACGDGGVYVRFTPEIVNWLKSHSVSIPQGA